jgi:hypothetical protein
MRGPQLALVCTGASLLVASVALAQDPYREFRIPDARSFSWIVSSGARWDGGDSNSPFNSTLDRSRSADLSSYVRLRTQSDRHVMDLHSDLAGNWNQDRSSSVYHDDFIREDRWSAGDFDTYRAALVASTAGYWGDTDWGLDAAFSAAYGFRRVASVSNRHLRYVPSSHELLETSAEENRYYNGAGNAALGLGLGRIRDATGVFSVQVLEQRLKATGRLLRPLSPGARQRLAQLFAVSPLMGDAHDRPGRFFWGNVEHILREDGAITDGTLDAYSLIRLLEPSSLGFRYTRLAGWHVSPRYVLVLARGHADHDEGSLSLLTDGGVPVFDLHSESHSRTKLDQTSGRAQLVAEYQRPWGMRWQARIVSTLSYGDGASRLASVTGGYSVDHLVADRWLISGSLSHEVNSVRRGGARVHPTWSLLGIVQAQYFVEDSWSLSASYRHVQSRGENVYFQPTYTRFDRFNDFRLGLTYRPVGRFEAPWLGVSERLTPVRL